MTKRTKAAGNRLIRHLLSFLVILTYPLLKFISPTQDGREERLLKIFLQRSRIDLQHAGIVNDNAMRLHPAKRFRQGHAICRANGFQHSITHPPCSSYPKDTQPIFSTARHYPDFCKRATIPRKIPVFSHGYLIMFSYALKLSMQLLKGQLKCHFYPFSCIGRCCSFAGKIVNILFFILPKESPRHQHKHAPSHYCKNRRFINTAVQHQCHTHHQQQHTAQAVGHIRK